MTAFLLPVLLLAMLGGTTVLKALHDRRELQSLAQSACNVAVKPQRMTVMADEQRRQQAEKQFDLLAQERRFQIMSRTVTAGWLEATVTASATVETVPGWGTQMAIPIVVSSSLPRYPALSDAGRDDPVIKLHDASRNAPDRSTAGAYFRLNRSCGTAGAGYGVEIQDWRNGFVLLMDGVTQRLPAQVSNTYVVELDSGARQGQTEPTYIPPCGIQRPGFNSSMYKNIELHPGNYRLSMWFRARAPRNYIVEKPVPETNTTNKVVVYLRRDEAGHRKEGGHRLGRLRRDYGGARYHDIEG